MTHDNHESHIFNCPIENCNQDALNKGIAHTRSPDNPDKTDDFRIVFCLEHKQQLIPIDQASKAIKKLDHEFEFYKGTHLEPIYTRHLPEKFADYQKMIAKKAQK